LTHRSYPCTGDYSPTPALPHGVASSAGIRRRRCGSGPQRVRLWHPDVGGGRARPPRPRPAVLSRAPPQPVRACAAAPPAPPGLHPVDFLPLCCVPHRSRCSIFLTPTQLRCCPFLQPEVQHQGSRLPGDSARRRQPSLRKGMQNEFLPCFSV
jgi:hypothetical protein